MIAERKAEYASPRVETAEDDVGMKKKLAFLDLLIEASEVEIFRQIDAFNFYFYRTGES